MSQKAHHQIKGRLDRIDGVPVLYVSYSADFLVLSHVEEAAGDLLIELYDSLVWDSDEHSCIVMISAEFEAADLGMMRALIRLWDVVTDREGRLAVVGYPSMTIKYERVLHAPLLPSFGLARDLESALRWIKAPVALVGGDAQIRGFPGVSYGRCLVPGEKALTSWDRTDV